ncbi:MAG: hypothetical protein IJ106_11640 [Parasporobacterium sp.]|nr:hypothetical protein [Parasporobacterium sp.]
MKIFNIINEEDGICTGVLLYYEKEKTFIIELAPELDEWSAPLLLSAFIKRREFTIPREISRLWVQERIIPSGRQNISSILSTHRLKSYDEIRFLELSEGRCIQDSLFIQKTDHLPDYVLLRQQKNLLDCCPLEDNDILCFFADDSTKKIRLSELEQTGELEKIRKNKALFRSGKTGTGGYYMTFDDVYDISASALYSAGTSIPLSLKDFLSFFRKNILDTSETCKVLGCSRQNLSYMIKQNRLTPVKENVKGTLFCRGNILQNQW